MIQWTEIGGCKTECVARHTSIIHQNKLYVIGGTKVRQNDQLLPSKDFNIFDFNSKSWKQQEIPGFEEITGHSTTLYNDKMYIFGGSTLMGFSNILSELDLEQNTWINVKLSNNKIKDRFGHTAVLIEDNIIIYGGLYYNYTWTFYPDAFEINLKKKTVQKITYENQFDDLERGSHASISYQNKMITFGGLTKKGRLNCLLSLEKVKDEVYKWKTLDSKGDIPCKRAGSAMCLHKDECFISGGFDGAKTLSDLYSYSLKDGYWKEIKIELLTKIRLHSMDTYNSQNGTFIVVYGGVTQNESELKNELQVLQIDSHTIMKNLYKNKEYQDVLLQFQC